MVDGKCLNLHAYKGRMVVGRLFSFKIRWNVAAVKTFFHCLFSGWYIKILLLEKATHFIWKCTEAVKKDKVEHNFACFSNYMR